MRLVKTIIFHLLLTFRGIIRFSSRLLALISFIGFALILWTMDYHDASMAVRITILMFGVIFMLINWLYDYLIFYFKPEDFEIMLSI